MKTTSKALLSAAILLLPAASLRAGEWEIDSAHSRAGFSVRHVMVSTVHGSFGAMTGTASIDDTDLTRSSVQVTIDATTIDTNEPKRDAHLKSADFFDVEKYPTITFKSTKVAKTEDGFTLTGDLTMHGQTHPVTLMLDGPTAPVKNPWGKMVRGLSATGKLDRKEGGLTWNKALEAGGVVVDDTVKLSIDVELVQKDAPAPAPVK